MSVLNKKAMYDLKWNYNYNLRRYYNGCNYLEKHPEEFDKYIDELNGIKENLEILINEIMKQENVNEKEILGGFVVEQMGDI